MGNFSQHAAYAHHVVHFVARRLQPMSLLKRTMRDMRVWESDPQFILQRMALYEA